MEGNADGERSSQVRAAAALREAGVDLTKVQAVFVPGRIEFLGKHTDYCGGRSLLCAVERGIDFVYAPRDDAAMRVFHPASGARLEFDLSPDLSPPAGHWSNYLITVARRVARNFPGALRGVDVAIDGDLPPAAGLSSSSALIVGMFMVLAAANHITERPEYRAAIATEEELAGYLGTIENGQSFTNRGATLAGDRGVGTMGGSQDHTAILCARPGALRQYGFFPVRYEGSAPMPAGYRFVIACSGIEAEKTGAAQAAYNRNPLVVRELLRQWNSATGGADPCLAAAVRSDPAAVHQLRAIIADAANAEYPTAVMRDRLEQFVEESERIIPAAAAALRTGDLATLGTLVDESQRWAERGLGNQIPQTVFLARSARESGAVAASAFGAGFGGSVWALVRDQEVEAFSRQWLERYRQAFPSDATRAHLFVTSAGAGARSVPLT